MNEAIKRALETDKTIDIITIGRKSGLQRTTEIWFHTINGRIIICGTPGKTGSGPRAKRDWLANLKAHPEFTFYLKESVQAQLSARAHIITDEADRRAILSAPETAWYRDQGYSVEDLVKGSPVIEVELL